MLSEVGSRKEGRLAAANHLDGVYMYYKAINNLYLMRQL